MPPVSRDLLKIFLFFLIILLPSIGQASFSKAQTGVISPNGAGGVTATCTFASNPATGDLVTVGVNWYSGGSATITFTVQDSNSNAYTVDGSNSGLTNITSAGYIGQAYLLSAPSNASKAITVTFNQSATDAVYIWCDDWTATGGTTTHDSSAFANGSGNPINQPTITVGHSSELVYCTAVGENQGDITGATGAFTANQGGQADGTLPEWATGQSANTACSYSFGNGDPWNAIGMSFYTASAPTTTSSTIRGNSTISGNSTIY